MCNVIRGSKGQKKIPKKHWSPISYWLLVKKKRCSYHWTIFNDQNFVKRPRKGDYGSALRYFFARYLKNYYELVNTFWKKCSLDRGRVKSFYCSSIIKVILQTSTDLENPKRTLHLTLLFTILAGLLEMKADF